MNKISYAWVSLLIRIQQAVWLYARFTLSFRDVEDLLVERGIVVSYEDGASLGEMLRARDRS
jgi:putative transposase